MVSAETLLGAASSSEVAFKANSGVRPAFRSRAYAIAERRVRVRLEEGFDTVLLIGDPGVGKTTLLSSLSAELAWSRRVIRLTEPSVDPGEALARWADIQAAENDAGHVIAIADDADLLPIELQMAAREPRSGNAASRVQFVFAVKPSAYARFAGVAAHLDEAMACCSLGRLEDDEVPEFVAHRLAAAGADPGLFTREALSHVASCAQGVPRVINLICAKACFLSGLNSEARVSAASVEEAAFALRLGGITIGRPPRDFEAAQSAA